MKKKNAMRRAASAVMGAALCVSMALPSFAMTPANFVNITMRGATGGSMFSDGSVSGSGTFGAYRIMDLTTSLKAGDTCTGEHTKDCYNYNYAINSKYQAALNAAAAGAEKDGVSGISDKELLDYLGAMENNGDAIRTFADALYRQVRSLDVDKTANEAGKFLNLPQGYYLIAETGAGTSPDSRSLVMLDTHGELEMTVTSKEGVPELTKTVADTNSNTFEESVMAGINEEVTFKLEGSLPKNIFDYGFYKYAFHDTLPAGLAYVDGSMKVTFGGVDVTEFFTANKSCADNCTICFACANLLGNDIMDKAGAGLDQSSKIVVTYNAKVTDAVRLGNPGNTNKAELEFSNDPYDESSTDKTPEDVASVFAVKLEVDKTDANGNPLTGAGFTLSKWNGTEYVALGAASVAGNIHTFSGLGDGKYMLSETTVPSGYNKAEDIVFTIGDDTYNGDNVKVAQTLKSFTVTNEEGAVISTMNVDVGNGMVRTVIENRSGSQLPSTGAAGTYAIYGTAVVLLAAGVTIFVLKKKSDKIDE